MLRIEIPRTRQPRAPVRINWENPITKGLVFCAIPCGKTMIDLVTGVVGTPNGVVSQSYRRNNGGKSLRAEGMAITGDGASASYVSWPVDSKLRGGSLNQIGTVLCLGGSDGQTDGKFYLFGGNCSLYDGSGFGLSVDSSLDFGRGMVISCTYFGSKINSSYPNPLLGTSFGDKTHYFGYAFTGNGASGNWLAEGKSTAWSGGATNGYSALSHSAVVLQPSINAGSHGAPNYVKMFQMWDRPLSPAEYADLYANPWQIFEPEVIYIPIDASAATQFLRPISDSAMTGVWNPSTGTDHYAMVDEVTADPADYIFATAAGDGRPLALTAGGSANINGGTLSFQLLAGSGNVSFALRQSGSIIQTFGPYALTGSTQDITATITATTSDANNLTLTPISS